METHDIFWFPVKRCGQDTTVFMDEDAFPFREEDERKCKDGSMHTNAFHLPTLLIKHSCVLQTLFEGDNSGADAGADADTCAASKWMHR